MNVRSMQKGVQQQLSAMDVPMVSEDILYYLNRAQEQYIDEQYIFLRGKYTDNRSPEIYQNAQKAIENLRTLVASELFDNTKIAAAVSYKNAQVISLPTDFYYYVRSETLTEVGGDWVNNRLVEQENIQKFIETKYNKPVFRDFLVLLQGSEAFVFYDTQQAGADLEEINLTYLKTPTELTLDNPAQECILPVHTHKDIVNIAVQLIVQDQQLTGNPRLRQIQEDGE